jgi:hypothetical protein
MTDATSSWTTAPTTWRQSRADTANFIHIFSGLAEEPYEISFTQLRQQSVNGSDATADIGIGYNSTSALTGMQGRAYANEAVANGVVVMSSTAPALHMATPAIGINKINAIEQAPTGTTSNTFFGSASLMLMTAKWRG